MKLPTAPTHIPNRCEQCGSPLALADVLDGTPEDEMWLDEWRCPACGDGTYMDWDEAEWDVLRQALKEPATHILTADGQAVPLC